MKRLLLLSATAATLILSNSNLKNSILSSVTSCHSSTHYKGDEAQIGTWAIGNIMSQASTTTFVTTSMTGDHKKQPTGW